MKKYFCILSFIILYGAIYAQTPTDEVLNRMNYVFAKVNRGNVSTGLLSNYGVQAIPPLPHESFRVVIK